MYFSAKGNELTLCSKATFVKNARKKFASTTIAQRTEEIKLSVRQKWVSTNGTKFPVREWRAARGNAVGYGMSPESSCRNLRKNERKRWRL